MNDSPLLAPVALGGVTAPNRVMFGPTETNLGDGRAIGGRQVAFYERRARGGAGVVVIEQASVHPTCWPTERTPLADECGPGWAEVAAACRAHGSVVIAALGHSGGQGSSALTQEPLWAPSRVPEVNTREVPKAMEAADIDAVIEGFASATRRAVAAGLDGVEINAGQHSLIRQFLSGLTNHRADEWAERERFAVAVLEAVRAASPTTVVGLRLSCDELAPWAGITPEAGAALAARLAAQVDYVVVVRGSIYSVGATRPDTHVDPGFNLELTAAVRAAVREAHGDRVPVFAQGSIVDVAMAEQALTDGVADGVEMTRAQLADADLVAKVRAGAVDRVRPCILCNQTCQVRDARNPIITCVVDPLTGYEWSDPDPGGRALEPRQVVVVGGGPAGLEAARIAADRGHEVVLIERGEQTGGALRVAAAAAGRAPLARFVDWAEAECRALGVEIVTGHEVEATDPALTVAGRAVIVATGGRPGDRGYRVSATAQVLDVGEVLAGVVPPEGRILIWDPIGGPIGVSVAETLAAAGRDVELASPDWIVGNELARSGDLAPANARLQQAGVVLHRRSILRAVRRAGAELEDRVTGELRRVKVAAVVDAGFRLPEEALWQGLRERGAGAVGVGAPERIGDAVAPRSVLEAVLEARRAVLALG